MSDKRLASSEERLANKVFRVVKVTRVAKVAKVVKVVKVKFR